MNVERFSPGVRQELRDRRSDELDGLAQEEIGLSRQLGESGHPDLSRLAVLFAMASDTAEVRAQTLTPEKIDSGVIHRALAGDM